MAHYYYFAATLPLLLYHEPPRITVAAFLDGVSRLLGKADAEAVMTARLENYLLEKHTSPLFRRFQEWETALRSRLAVLRAASRKEDAAAYERRRVRPIVEAERTARAAFEAADPLTAEEILNRARWEVLSGLGSRHFFNREFLIAYALKLQLLERKALLVRAVGERRHAALEAELDKELAEKLRVS